MKKLKFLLLFISVAKLIDAQTISPTESDEFCPNTEITFKVFYEGGFVSLSASNGAYITQAPYGFTGNYFYFKAKFADAIIRKVTKLLLESSFY